MCGVKKDKYCGVIIYGVESHTSQILDKHE